MKKLRHDETLSPGVQGHDGAEVHRVHVSGVGGQDLLDDDSVGPLWRMERVPERVDVPVGAQVGGHRAQPQSVVAPLPAARHLRCHETCADRGHVHQKNGQNKYDPEESSIR